jgi:hypothetical protein
VSRGFPHITLKHRPAKSAMPYLERVAGVRGDDALAMWLYFRDTKGKWQPRYVEHKKSGEIVAQKNDGGGMPTDCQKIPDQRALFYVLDRLTKKGMLSCSS